MTLHAAVADRLARLAPDQRAAATAPPGPVLCVAPAGSGKTTTLVARVAWRIATGADPAGLAVITFNRRAAEELGSRLADALEPLGQSPTAVRVRTFHALGREILISAGLPVDPLVERAPLLRELFPTAGPAGWRRLDDAFSRLKLDAGVTAADVAADPDPGPIGRAFLAYEAALADAGGLDFDEMVAHALRALEEDARLLAEWRTRCRELFVDEVQDVDRTQLRLALLLAAPANRIFLVGDDDQTIYGWRLADVRRVLGLAHHLPGLRRVDLVTNYRCPGPVVERAVRLVANNRERFAKDIRARRPAPGRLILAPDGSDDVERAMRVLRTLPADAGSRAVLARTNRELVPVAVAALELDLPFRADGLTLPLEAPGLDRLLERVATTDAGLPLLLRLARVREEEMESPVDPEQDVGVDELAAWLLAWAAPYADLDAFRAAIRERRDRLASLRRDDAGLTLATAHGTKGLEFDHVAVIGLDDGRFPSARSLAEAPEPERALEEERRLAYVAWTRARRSLTLVYDPGAPSRFLREAFDADELGAEPAA